MNRKRKLGRELLCFLLTLAMVVGLVPGMSLTAHADEPTEQLLTTITATGSSNAAQVSSANVSYSVENVAIVSFSNLPNYGTSYTANWGWWGYAMTLTVTPADGYTITKCVFYDDKERTAEDSEAPFVVETTEDDKTPQVNGTPILAYQSKGIKKIEVYGYATSAHTHDFTYSASEATITAICSADDCSLTDKKATLVIAAPQNLTYDGSAKAAVITDASGIQGSAKVMYQKKDGNSYGTATETAPKDAGTYKAGITLGSATASVEYTIEPVALTISGATLTDRMYQANNKKVEVSSVTFTGGSPVVNTDYTATAEMTDDAVGDNKSATVTVTLKNNNYTLAANTTQSTVNITRYRPDAPGAPTAAEGRALRQAGRARKHRSADQTTAGAGRRDGQEQSAGVDDERSRSCRRDRSLPGLRRLLQPYKVHGAGGGAGREWADGGFQQRPGHPLPGQGGREG